VSRTLRHRRRVADEPLVTNFIRTPALLAGRLRRLPFLISILLLAGLALAAPAGAVVSEVEGTSVGLQPRTASLFAPSSHFANEAGNAVVSGTTSVYVVYWDPGAWFHHEWVSNIDGFVQNLGASSGRPGTIFDSLPQYVDRANARATDSVVFKGAYHDFAPYPAEECEDPEPLQFVQIGCVTDTQVREQLQSFISAHGTAKGMNAIYYLLTPPGVSVCLDKASTHCSDYTRSAKEINEGVRASETYKHSFCSYHGAINPDNASQGDGNTVLYAAIPWSAGYEGHPWDFAPEAGDAGQAYDCQDGGWNVEGHEEKFEKPKEISKAEEELFAGQTPEEQEKTLKKRSLEGPHIQEPNQEGRGEEGDYAPALSDVIVNQIAVEQANIVTDPLLSSWHDTLNGREATDECRNVFVDTAAPSAIGGSVSADGETEAGTLSNESVGGGTYYINTSIDNGALHVPECVGGNGLVPRFTSPNPVSSGELVDFNGMESTVSEFKGATFAASGPPSTTYATFSWNFGDGTTASGYAPGSPACEAPWLSPCAASEVHSYTYGGTYRVTLTILDTGGHTATVEHEVSVVGPPPPAPTPPAGSPGASGGSAGSGTAGAPGGSKGSPAPTPAPAPAAKAAVASRSLRTALRKGLPVSYSVNQQVTGHFEVLMARSLAAKLGIGGAPATGLPAGTPPQLVIAKAILVTTKGGAGAVHIKFSKKVAARLKRVHSAPLMLRLVVRNGASAGSPTATVLSSITLAG
jgi:hypothetical protein